MGMEVHMVAIQHDHSDGNICPSCRFRKAMAEFLARAHGDGREAWHWTVGDLRHAMHSALLSLDAIDAAAFDDDSDERDDDPVVDAADAITDVGAEIEQLWHLIMGQGDDAE
jgi:hypothetical protein